MGSNEPTFSFEKGSSLNCIIFIALTNRYEHPHQETLEVLAGIGSDINFISKEIEKLVSYTAGREAVTIEDVNEVPKNESRHIWKILQPSHNL